VDWLRPGARFFLRYSCLSTGRRESVCLETYISALVTRGRRSRRAGAGAGARRAGRVLIDALGSISLGAGFWEPLRAAGGEVRQFNPLALNRLDSQPPQAPGLR